MRQQSGRKDAHARERLFTLTQPFHTIDLSSKLWVWTQEIENRIGNYRSLGRHCFRRVPQWKRYLWAVTGRAVDLEQSQTERGPCGYRSHLLFADSRWRVIDILRRVNVEEDPMAPCSSEKTPAHDRGT